MLSLPFASQRDNSPLSTGLIYLCVHPGSEVDSAHDAITKLLIEDRLEGVAVGLYNLVETVNEGLCGWHGPCLTPEWVSLQLLRKGFAGNIEGSAELVNVLGRGCCLSVEERSNCNFGAAGDLGKLLKSHTLCCLGLEKKLAVGGQMALVGNLESMLIWMALERGCGDTCVIGSKETRHCALMLWAWVERRGNLCDVKNREECIVLECRSNDFTGDSEI